MVDDHCVCLWRHKILMAVVAIHIIHKLCIDHTGACWDYSSQDDQCSQVYFNAEYDLKTKEKCHFWITEPAHLFARNRLTWYIWIYRMSILRKRWRDIRKTFFITSGEILSNQVTKLSRQASYCLAWWDSILSGDIIITSGNLINSSDDIIITSDKLLSCRVS